MQDNELIKIEVHDTRLITKGANAIGYDEFQITIPDSDLAEPGIGFLQYLCDHLVSHRPEIKIGETFAYGCWLTRFNKIREGYIQIGEYMPDEDAYTGNTFHALEVWKVNNKLARKWALIFYHLNRIKWWLFLMVSMKVLYPWKGSVMPRRSICPAGG